MHKYSYSQDRAGFDPPKAAFQLWVSAPLCPWAFSKSGTATLQANGRSPQLVTIQSYYKNTWAASPFMWTWQHHCSPKSGMETWASLITTTQELVRKAGSWVSAQISLALHCKKVPRWVSCTLNLRSPAPRHLPELPPWLELHCPPRWPVK